MPGTSTDICNNALALLGANLITDIDDTSSNNAVLCKRLYSPTVEELLRSHTWNFSIARQKLTQSASTPAFDYDYIYPLPSGEDYCLRVIRVNDNLDDFLIEGRYIITDASSCNLVYIKLITDTSQFDSLFRQALETKLGAKLAVAIRQENNLSLQLLQRYDQIVGLAKQTDAIESRYNLSKNIDELMNKSRWLNYRTSQVNRTIESTTS